LKVDDVVKAAEGLIEVAVAAANREWSAEPMRQDALIRANSAIEGVGLALQAYHQKVDRDLAGDAARFKAGPEFDTFVGRGLALLVLEALRLILSALTSNSAQEHEEWARTRVMGLLAQWEKHVEDHGPLDPPEFAAGRDMHNDSLGDDDIAAITAMVVAEPRDTMWQLCQASDIGLLDAGTSQVAAVRFAPRAVLVNSGGVFPVRTEWISSAKHAGMLRFVPLRRGVVHRTWSTDNGLAEG
jgi:hypothetical protein